MPTGKFYDLYIASLQLPGWKAARALEEKMNLTTGEIYDLYLGLTQLDQAAELKLAAGTRFKIALNLSRAKAIAAAYESARAKKMAELEASGLAGAALQSALIEENDRLRAITHDVELRSLLKAELRLDDNPKISASAIAAIWPLIDGRDD